MTNPGTSVRTSWSRCRGAFRLFRIALLTATFLLLAALTWLRVFGLPNFLRVRLVHELAQRGVVANFRSLHFHWFRGLVAQDLRVAWGGPNHPGVEFQIAEADLDVAPPLAWRNRSTLLRGISIRRGNLSIPLSITNEPPFHLQLQDISAQILFRQGDHWDIPRLAARLEGVEFELSAQITNTTALRRPKPSPDPADPAARERAIRLARSFVQELRSWTDASSAKITVHLAVDGARLPTSHGDVFLDVPSAHTPDGNVVDLRLSARVQPGTRPDEPSHASLFVELGDLQTAHGGLSQLAVRAQFLGPPGPALLTNATWETRVDHVFMRGFRARNATVTGTTRIPPSPNLLDALFDTDLEGHATRLEFSRGTPEPLTIHNSSFGLRLIARPTLQIPDHVEGTLAAGSIEDAQGTTGLARVRIALATRNAPPTPVPPGIAFWSIPWPLTGHIDIDVADVHSPRFSLDRFHTVLRWDAPRLTIRELEANLYQGRLRARGDLDVVSRVATLSAESTFNLHGLDPILGPRSLENFLRYQWVDPPQVEAQARLTLPPWNITDVDWEAIVKPTVRVEGRVKVAAGSYKGIPFDEANSSIAFDGTTWRLPDIRSARPEGRQEIAVEYNEDTREYRIDARGRVLPHVLKPVLGEASGEIVDLFEFRNAVDAEVVVWGPWAEGTRQSILGTVVATNFIFRAQRFDRLESSIRYTNRFLAASPVLLTRDAGQANVEGVGYDFAEDRLWLTNAINTIDPVVVAAAINPSFPEKLAHYRFETPPRIHAQGTLRPRHTETADMTFSVTGGPFDFWRLRAETIETGVLWKGNTLTLTNVSGRFFDGTFSGNAFFELDNPEDGLYRFDAQVRQADLGKILRHASGGRTNVTSGEIGLDLSITSARTADLNSWNGSGRAELKDGLLWDAPIFGFVSPVLNAVVPGLGNNRASAAEATFTLTNSIIHTRDLTIDCPPAKLFYRGTVDFDQNVNAKVEAQILGNFTPMGPLFGLILRPLTKLFEFRVTGTLDEVKAEPLYVPKFLLLPLRLLRGILGPGGSGDHPPVVHTQPEITSPTAPDPGASSPSEVPPRSPDPR